MSTFETYYFWRSLQIKNSRFSSGHFLSISAPIKIENPTLYPLPRLDLW